MLFKKASSSVLLIGFFLVVLTGPAAANGRLDRRPDRGEPVRYMALGDSIAAGQGALPATRGYVYRLYLSGVFGRIDETIFNNGGISGATSRQVLDYQIPQAIEAFRPTVVTLTFGGNDLLTILEGADAAEVLALFQANLTELLRRLRLDLPDAEIYLSNLYSIPEIAGSEQVVPLFNLIVSGVAAQFGVPVADVYSAFSGRRGLIQPGGVHPTNAGHRAIAGAFEEIIRKRR